MSSCKKYPGGLLVLLLLLIPSAAWSQVTAIIAGPKQASVGDLVVLDGSGSSGSAFRWVLVGSKKTFLQIEGGKKVVFASGTAGEYVFVLVVGGQVQGGGMEVATQEYRLQVGGSPVPDNPNPPPDNPRPDPPPNNPNPPPTVPPGAFDLTKIGYDATIKLSVNQRKIIGEMLADNFESTSAAIAAGGIKTIKEANESLATKNRNTVGSDRDVWVPVIQAFADRMTALSREGKLSTLEAHQDAYRAFGDGLRIAARQP